MSGQVCGVQYRAGITKTKEGFDGADTNMFIGVAQEWLHDAASLSGA